MAGPTSSATCRAGTRVPCRALGPDPEPGATWFGSPGRGTDQGLPAAEGELLEETKDRVGSFNRTAGTSQEEEDMGLLGNRG